ncbi:MAG: hypothetical protein AB7U20_16305 [Planctomycetaceae bacterium]
MSPGLLTLRELVWMAESRQSDAWNHTASVLALLANAHRDPKKTRPLKPADFHPLRKPTPTPPAPPKADISILKTVFVDRGPLPRGDR